MRTWSVPPPLTHQHAASATAHAHASTTKTRTVGSTTYSTKNPERSAPIPTPTFPATIATVVAPLVSARRRALITDAVSAALAVPTPRPWIARAAKIHHGPLATAKSSKDARTSANPVAASLRLPYLSDSGPEKWSATMSGPE